MMRSLVFLFSSLALTSYSQMVTSTQQKALNNYVDYANQSSKEISSVVGSIISYHPQIAHERSRPSNGLRYACPIQQEEYYYKKALEESKALGNGTSLNVKLNNLRAAADKIDKVCKQLDVYHKLQDYKTDNYAKAELLIESLPPLIAAYRDAQATLDKELRNTLGKFQAGNQSAYILSSKIMREAMSEEKSFLDLWDYNLEESVPSGWVAQQLEASILKTETQVKRMQSQKNELKYPASSQYTAFVESLSTILNSKRNALDDYNVEARKSDKHANAVYRNLINYYNGTLVSFYNSFLQCAQNDGYHDVKEMEYVPSFSIRKEAVTSVVKVAPFADVPFSALAISNQPKPIASPVATALNTYVDFINECVRQSGFIQQRIHNLNASATRYKGLTNFEGKGQLQYEFSTFKIPVSLYQEVLTSSKSLPPNVAHTLHTQAEVLINVLKEMEQRSAQLEMETSQKLYEKDRVEGMFNTFERYAVLFETLDKKKELLNHDLRQVYDSYPIADPNWIISWKALRALVDDDHGALFQAKAFYKGVTSTLPDTKAIDANLREVMANEFDNMKGIEKYGRSNGLCPYTPYENIPETSRRFSEKLNKVSTPPTSSSRHPYHDLVYLYNDIVDAYNKFCTLSKMELLKTVRQPEYFEVVYPTSEPKPQNEKPQVRPSASVPVTTMPDAAVKPNPSIQPSDRTKVMHDTVYIEKRDTIYLGMEGEDFHSMEGYAVNNLVLLLDVSGSMNSADKLPLLKQSVFNLLTMMRQEDQVSIIVYSGKAKVLLPPTSFKEEDKIKKAIKALKSSGTTDGNAGIKLAYQVADKNYIRGGNNRIVLATDGEFAIQEEAGELVKKFSGEDIFLSVFNFGKGAGASSSLEKLCTLGHGNYEHITRDNMESKLIREVKAKRAK